MFSCESDASSDESQVSHAGTSRGSHGTEHRHPPHLRGREIGLWYAKHRKVEKSEEEVPTVMYDQMFYDELEQIIMYLPKTVNYQSEAKEMSRASISFQRYIHECSSDNEWKGLQDWSHCAPVQDSVLSEKLFHEFQSRDKGKDSAIQQFRRNLPAFSKREELLKLLENNQVIVVSGETGCGKTTQVPQYILDYFIEMKAGSTCKIICTQPRRISAISVAERVAEERGVTMSSNSDVGYQIRLESKLPRESGSILFCTTGIVLQMMRDNPMLSGMSHVIVDEVHERDLHSDFLIINLRDVIKYRKDLKVILMSATLNAEEFSAYFDNCPMLAIPGFTYSVEEYYLEDIIEMTGYVLSSEDRRREPIWVQSENREKDHLKYKSKRTEYIRNLDEKYSSRTRSTLRNFDEEEIDFYLIYRLLKHICSSDCAGAVLIFLPGWQEISKLHRLITDDLFFSPSRYLIIPLHSLMPTINQREVFKRPPEGVRKIIIATTIAETSITIDDVVFVIDCGKIKMKSFDPIRNLQLLQPCWVAISNARQRRGRAGRTQPGKCYHMYTKFKECHLNEYQEPEMLRSSLDEMILQIKILKHKDVIKFLNKALNPPNQRAVETSLNALQRLNALDLNENLTPLGYCLAQIPAPPHIGKMLIYAAIFSCLDPILSVAANLTYKDAFVVPLGKENLVDDARRELSRGSQSDHLLFAYALKDWERSLTYGNDKVFCREYYLSPSILKLLSNFKTQFAQHLRCLGFIQSANPKDSSHNHNSNNETILTAIICAGLYPNVGKVTKNTDDAESMPNHQKYRRSLKVYTNARERAQLHFKSVNAFANVKTQWMVYYLKIKSKMISLHDTTVISPCALLLFGGPCLILSKDKSGIVAIDDWIEFKLDAFTAKIMELRLLLDEILNKKICDRCFTDWNAESDDILVLQSVANLLSQEHKSLNRLSAYKTWGQWPSSSSRTKSNKYRSKNYSH